MTFYRYNREDYMKNDEEIQRSRAVGEKRPAKERRTMNFFGYNREDHMKNDEEIQRSKAVGEKKLAKKRRTMNIPEFKSIKHCEKIQRLIAVGEEKLTKVEPPLKFLVAESSFSLGSGSKGTCVYVGILDDGSEVAVKRMLIQTCKDTAENEREILTLIDTKKSPFIVSYRHFFKDNTFMYLIVDLCEEALDDYVQSQSNEQLQENARRMIREMLTGLQFLHDQGILHRDLKPSNILVDAKGHMKLADFGISRVLNEDETTIQTNANGTLGWMPAEVIETLNQGGKGKFKKKSDVQVAGMIAYFILSKGEHPFGPSLDRMSNISNGYPVYLEKLPDADGREFIAMLIKHKITDRPYAREALEHAYINEALQPPPFNISCHDDNHPDENIHDPHED